MGDFIKKILKTNMNFSTTNFNFKRVATFLLIFIFLATVVFVWLVGFVILDESYLYDENYSYGDDNQSSCNVEGIPIRGTLATYIPSNEDGKPMEDYSSADEIIYWIGEAEKNKKIKAIYLEVDSYGGYPVAAEEVANALKRAQKPTVALIREGGVSAAYWATTGADLIFASKNSDVGSIGVTMSYLDSSRKNQLEGLSYIQLSSGKFKDTGDPNKSLTAEERLLLMRDVNIIHQNFIEAVADNRQLDIQAVSQLADGSTMLGEMALANGLIDRIGGIFEVKDYLKELIGEEVDICW